MSTQPQMNTYSHIKRALNRAYPPDVDSLERSAAWGEYRALLKDAEAHRNFWQSAYEGYEEKVEYNECLMIIAKRDGSVLLDIVRWDDGFNHEKYAMFGYDGYEYAYDPEWCAIDCVDTRYSVEEVTHFAKIPPLPDDDHEEKNKS